MTATNTAPRISRRAALLLARNGFALTALWLVGGACSRTSPQQFVSWGQTDPALYTCTAPYTTLA